MSISYEHGGRATQKARTRNALIDGGRGLLAQGIVPTVEAAAAAAGISRPTAYRYFKNQQALLVAAHPEITKASLLGDDAPEDALERLAIAARFLTQMVVRDEAALRAMLSISLDRTASAQSTPLRAGRRIMWVEDALAPVRAQVGQARFQKLVVSVAAVLGIETLVWLTDIAGLSREEARAHMQSMALAIARSSLTPEG
ncbi:MAG: TetR family transcriptional regulator [Candidatus Baltobacteraceae bacterium]